MTSEESTSPEQRNDAEYRRTRKDRLTQQILTARMRGATTMLVVTRYDCDVRELVDKYGLIVKRGGDPPTKADRAGDIPLWVVDDSAKCCADPPCSAGAGLPGIALKRCSRCREARYCSQVCQRAHYAQHSIACKKE